MGITIVLNLIMLSERYVASQQRSLHICYLRTQLRAHTTQIT